MSRRVLIGFVLATGLSSGCASNARRVGLRAEQLGAFRFNERVGPDVELKGTFLVESDTVSIDASPGPCRYERERSNALAITYTCGDVSYVFERSDPMRTARYSTILHLTETRSVCVRYAVNSAGRTVCAEFRNETLPHDVRRSGLLRPERVADDDPNHDGS